MAERRDLDWNYKKTPSRRRVVEGKKKLDSVHTDVDRLKLERRRVKMDNRRIRTGKMPRPSVFEGRLGFVKNAGRKAMSVRRTEKRYVFGFASVLEILIIVLIAYHENAYVIYLLVFISVFLFWYAGRLTDRGKSGLPVADEDAIKKWGRDNGMI